MSEENGDLGLKNEPPFGCRSYVFATFVTEGRVSWDLETPYPGGNLFSLASGGAIYLRDPSRKVGVDQLNGGKLTTVENADWELILTYLKENQKLFGVKVEGLLKIGEHVAEPSRVYRKVDAIPLRALATANE
jgi:hypothetical protein